MIILFLSPIIEHLTQRIKEFLAGKLDTKKTSPYWAYWLAPFIAYGFSLLILWILGLNNLWQNAIITTGASIIWHEISHLWKKQKRETIPLHTKGLAESIKEIELK